MSNKWFCFLAGGNMMAMFWQAGEGEWGFAALSAVLAVIVAFIGWGTEDTT